MSLARGSRGSRVSEMRVSSQTGLLHEADAPRSPGASRAHPPPPVLTRALTPRLRSGRWRATLSPLDSGHDRGCDQWVVQGSNLPPWD
jgi:hypothetical protein